MEKYKFNHTEFDTIKFDGDETKYKYIKKASEYIKSFLTAEFLEANPNLYVINSTYYNPLGWAFITTGDYICKYPNGWVKVKSQEELDKHFTKIK